MSYVVNNSRGQIIAVVQDGTVNTTATSQTLVGKNVTPYGEYEVENLVHQLENFADSSPPGNPIEGQLWYDTDAGKVKVYSGSAWKTVSGLTVATTSPPDPATGDLWFNPTTSRIKVYGPTSTGLGWVPVNAVTVATTAPSAVIAGEIYFNSNTSQFFVYNGTGWSLIGPDGVSGFATTRWVSASLNDVGNVAHAVIECTVDGNIVAISSADNFTILPSQAPTGFTSLVEGINLSSTAVLNGVATRATKLETARGINGVPFDGTANITVVNLGELIAGSYLTGTNYSGAVNQTWAVDATSINTASKVVARDASGDFSARTIAANLIGNVSGIATNVSGVVAYQNGGTGYSSYSAGQILVGNGSGLVRAFVSGTSPIVVNSTANGIAISYTGGTGIGNVTSVGITAGPGIGVSGSPITGAGNILVTNTGVTQLNAGEGVSVNNVNGDVTVTNTGVKNIQAGTGISLSGTNANLTITNSGVTRLVAGTNISLSSSNGVVTITSTASGGGSSYTLPTASSTTLGGVKIGPGLGINTGVLTNTGVTSIIAGNNIIVNENNGSVTISSTGGGGGGTIVSVELAGSIKIWGGLTPPDNWAICDGSAVSRVTYATLFQRIGTTFGAGDGSTSFNLPDFRGKFGIGTSAGYPAGSTGGAADAKLIAHRHDFVDPATGARFFVSNDNLNRGTPGIPASWNTNNQGDTEPRINSPRLQNVNLPFIGEGPEDHGDASYYSWTSTVGEPATNSNLPPYLSANWIIKLNDAPVPGGGGGGGGGSGTVYAVTAGDGLLGGQITTAGTITVDSTVARLTVPQTFTSLKRFTNGIISQAYNFTTAGASIFYADPTLPGFQEPVVQIAVNEASATPYDYAHQFYNQRFVVEGSADPTTPGSNRPAGGAIIGIDYGNTGGGGVFGWHTNNIPGLGIGTGGYATNMTFTGAVFQGVTARPSSGDFVQIRSYSQNDVVFEVRGNGNVFYAGSVTAPGADYAEYFEWADGNPNSEDRVGISVALDGNRVRPAVQGDTVLGVVSANPSIVGDGAELAWAGQYLHDDWGRVLTEEYHAYNWTDEKGKHHSVASFEDTSGVPDSAVMTTVDGLGNKLVRPVLNPAYNPDIKYVPRSKRPEWAPVGLMGKLRLRKGQVTGAGWIKLRDISDTVEEWLVK